MRAWIMVSYRIFSLEGGDQVRKLRSEKGLKIQNAVDVYGPYDLVVEVNAEDINELYSKYIKEINRLPAIGGCTTYLAVDEKTNPRREGEPLAYMLIDAAPLEIEEIRDKISESENIRKADVVLGPFDVVAEFIGESLNEYRSMYKKLFNTPGIIRSVSLIRFE